MININDAILLSQVIINSAHNMTLIIFLSIFNFFSLIPLLFLRTELFWTLF